MGLKLNLNKDECNSIAYTTLWQCLKNYKSSKGRFIQYLKRSIRYNLINENKKIRGLPLSDIYYYKPVNITFDCLTDEESKLIKERYFDNYTLKELGIMYGCSYENIRIRLNNALEKLRKDFNGV